MKHFAIITPAGREVFDPDKIQEALAAHERHRVRSIHEVSLAGEDGETITLSQADWHRVDDDTPQGGAQEAAR